MPRMKVDLVLTNGDFCTLDSRMPDVLAVAVNDGRIVAVGTKAEIAARFDGKAEVNLNGAFVLPGLTDGHGHISDLGFSLTTLDLRDTKFPEDVAKLVQAGAAKSAAGGWIRGRGWNQEKWQNRNFPTHEILDKVAPDNYVFLVRVDGHAVWVNKKVLDLAGIARATKAPSGGRIIRDKNGDPTGVFLDAAVDLIASKIPPPTDSEVANAILFAADTCARYGLTEVHDARIDAQTLRVYKRLADEGKLRIRIYAMYLGTDSTLLAILKDGPLINYKEFFTMRSVKVYMDGALGSRGAALVQSYTDDSGNYGLTEMSEKDLENLTIASLSNGFQVCTHAIGDRANDIVLNAYENALKVAGVDDPRLRIEHAQVLLREDVSRFKKLGVIPSMQPTHCTSDMCWAEARLGPERIKYSYAWRHLLEDGNIIIGGSDFPVESPDPRLGIYAAVTRQDLNGLPRNFEDAEKYFEMTPDAVNDSSDFDGGFFPKEKMTLEEAMKAFTIWPAYGAFQEDNKGTISVGKYADFTILKKDFRTISPREIPEDEILGTIVAGKLVYASPNWDDGAAK
ncbi:MAG: amidohydrolase [Candidatus Kryptoniota bacterium]